VELVMGSRYALLAAAAFLLLGGLGADGYSLVGVRSIGLPSAAVVLLAFLGAAILGPALLPWLPGRAFSAKGAALGLASVAIAAWAVWPAPLTHWLHGAAWALLVPALASFVVMNFTGASTYTSLSGVLREMRFAVPAQIATAVIGVGLWLTGLFLHGGTTS
jgi:acetyl-CoA decarbonylase/synthase complex subunit gamma